MLKHLKNKKMELLNKSENWWLRLLIVVIILTSLSTLSYFNRQVTQVMAKSRLDSQIIDSLNTELFEKNTELATEEQVTDSLDKVHHGYAEERENVYNSNEFEH